MAHHHPVSRKAVGARKDADISRSCSAFTATYYQTSIMRTRRNVRDDMAREVAKKGLKADVEGATWLNLFSKSRFLEPFSLSVVRSTRHSCLSLVVVDAAVAPSSWSSPITR
jgi:hypothetical protein